MIRANEIVLYVFKEDDGLDGQERLLRAAELYCRDNAVNAGEAQAGKLYDSACFQVEKTPLGKPYFPKAKELHFSISHSGDYWVCAFAPQEVGVDIQEHVMNRNETRQEAARRFCKMAHRFFHPVEAQFVEKESFYRFFGIWAARESYVKYTGQGIDASFSEHCVIPETEERWPELTAKLPARRTSSLSAHMMQQPANVQSVQGNGESWQAQGAWFWETVFEENYTLCVCAAKEMPCRVITSLKKHFL